MAQKTRSRINAVRNNFYALRLVCKMCPRVVVHMAMLKALYYFGWLFYSAFFMRYVINALQAGETFQAIMIFIGITVAVFAAIALPVNVLCASVFALKLTVGVNLATVTLTVLFAAAL